MATILPSNVGQASEVEVPLSSQPSESPPLEQRVTLYNVSWDTYERLVAEIDNRSVRLAYDRGALEIMSPISQSHERFKKLLALLLEVLTEELGIPRRSLGATTWKRRELKKGIEADECYYLTSEPTIRGKEVIDLAVDPPPDLAIEVENTISAIEKLGIYSALGVPEVWRFDGQDLKILALQSNGEYAEQANSKFFPPAGLTKALEWIQQRNETDEITWIKEFRRWVRENLVKSR